MQAEVAELKATQGIASSSHTVSHRQRSQKGTTRQVARRYEIRVLSQEVGFLNYFDECEGHLMCNVLVGTLIYSNLRCRQEQEGKGCSRDQYCARVATNWENGAE